MKTLSIVKPDGVRKRLVGECIRRIKEQNLTIKKIKTYRMTKQQAELLRKDIKRDNPNIYDSMINYMTEGPSTFLLIEGADAIQKVRTLCGPTDPKIAPKGTIRGDFGEGDMVELNRKGQTVRNVIHSSANPEEAREEINIFFEEEMQ